MENHKNEMENFLKNKMSVDESEISEPDLSLVTEARKKIAARKSASGKREGFFYAFTGLLNLRIKLYQAGIAVLFIGLGIFYFTKNTNENNKQAPGILQFSNKEDSTGSSSVKDNIFLVKNFVSGIN